MPIYSTAHFIDIMRGNQAPNDQSQKVKKSKNRGTAPVTKVSAYLTMYQGDPRVTNEYIAQGEYRISRS